EGFFSASFTSKLPEARDQCFYFPNRLMPCYRPASTHPLGKVEPKFRVGTLALFASIAQLIFHVRQNSAAQLAFFQPVREFSQVSRESVYMMKIVRSILTQIIAGKLAGAPGFVKRMAEQIVFGDAGVELLEEILSGHHRLFLREEWTLYERMACEKYSV